MSTITLDQLPFGKPAIIIKLSSSALPIRRKLLSMGITPGCRLIAVRVAPFGDPIEIEIRGFHLCLRRLEAKSINVKLCEED